MPENKYAVNAPHSPEIMQRWGSVNLQKFILTGPAEIAAKLLERMMSNTNFEEHCFSREHQEVYTRGVAHIACEAAQHFWNDCEQRGWLLTQDQGTPEEEQKDPAMPVAVTGYSHVDLSDPNNPRALSEVEFRLSQMPQGCDGDECEDPIPRLHPASFSINSGVPELPVVDTEAYGHHSTDYGESGDDQEPLLGHREE
jgi:hypothetical protein